MTVPEHDVCGLVRELVAALDGLGDALAANDLTGLLASEPRLAQASAALSRLRPRARTPIPPCGAISTRLARRCAGARISAMDWPASSNARSSRRAAPSTTRVTDVRRLPPACTR